ncbi:hypothetical protein C8R47DRAFT_1068221 [Mycena vitilis]|nr:hypothetical protein C8R47DRAFT_1068221 [Mycena vitilis]
MSFTNIVLEEDKINIYHSTTSSMERVATYDLTWIRDRLSVFYTPGTYRIQGDLGVRITPGRGNENSYKAAKATIESGSIQFRIQGLPELLARVTGTTSGNYLEICWNPVGRASKPEAFYTCFQVQRTHNHKVHTTTRKELNGWQIFEADGDRTLANEPVSWTAHGEEICSEELRKVIDGQMWENFFRMYRARRQIKREEWVNATYQLLFLGFSALNPNQITYSRLDMLIERTPPRPRKRVERQKAEASSNTGAGTRSSAWTYASIFSAEERELSAGDHPRFLGVAEVFMNKISAGSELPDPPQKLKTKWVEDDNEYVRASPSGYK